MTYIRDGLDDYSFEKWETNELPIAYLLTFRTYGTWLHGDERRSVQRNGRNIYGTPRIDPNRRLKKWLAEEMKQQPFLLTPEMREIVMQSTKEVSTRRGFGLSAVNALSTHVHAVVSATQKPERVVDALKANATKMLRENGLASPETQIWSRGRSRRYLWKPQHVEAAIKYTLYEQGDLPFEITD